VPKKPTSTCRVNKRCPIRMPDEGAVPQGYTVKKRTLVNAA
jgi:hypothetical protein